MNPNSSPPTRIAVAGATGRMGAAIIECALVDARFDLVAALVAPNDPRRNQPLSNSPNLLYQSELPLDATADVLIDFTLPAGTMHWIEVCEKRHIPFLTGVTGHSESQLARISAAAHYIPVLHSANFSIGINALLRYLGPLLADLGEGYDIEIVETHHRAKIDAPSGTARTLANQIKATLAQNAAIRSSDSTPSTPGAVREIPIHSLRIGDVIGTHEIHLGGHGESIVLRHSAHSRMCFAKGALRAALWLSAQPAGHYSTKDMGPT